MGGDLRFTSCAYHLNDVDASANIHGTCGYIGFGAGDIISERAGTDNLFHASYDLRYANCSNDIPSSAHDLPCASCPHDFNDVGASDNLPSTCCSVDIPSSTNDLPRSRHGLRCAYNVWRSNVCVRDVM